ALGAKCSFNIFINMLCGGADKLIHALLERGYYFTGIHPLHEGREYIMLHKECAGGYVWEEFVMSESGKALLKYILEHK
ncbi:MAG: hypothetical protein IJC39_05700, partial [Firmicutes bacterium]|nr:hypothetical protein [Bacillota bacterium]